MGLTNFILTCEKDNKELRKDLEYYKNQNARLKKQIEEARKEISEYSYKLSNYRCEETYETQQKAFIKFLEDEIKQNTPSLRWKHYNEDGFNDYDVENPCGIVMQPIDKIYKQILKKYKEIIGVSNDKTN